MGSSLNPSMYIRKTKKYLKCLKVPLKMAKAL